MSEQQRPQLQNTTKVDTELPVKGMVKDPNTSLVGKEAWTHCRNCVNNSQKGDVGSIGNEPANWKCGCAPYTIIGAIHLYADKWIVMSTDNQTSEIALFDDSKCEYTTLVNDTCLNFNKRYLITGASKENFDCSWQIYWDDGLNPSRTLNLGFGDDIPSNRNIPWKQIITSPVDADGNPTSDCVIYEDAQPLRLDCERVRLAPFIDIPCMDLQKSKKGGQLRNGSYQAFIAYTLNEQKISDYVGTSNLQPLFSHEDGQASLTLEISNLDKEFEFFELVIASNNQGQMQAKKIGLYSTEQTFIEISYIDQKLESVPIEFLPLRTPAFEKSDKMYVVNDYLIRQGPTTQFDFNYQKHANEIIAHWVSVKYPANYYANGGNKTNFMRDEQYAFFIRFVYTTGEKSSSYHIPGRPPEASDTAIVGGSNVIDSDNQRWQVENTASRLDALPGYTVGSSLNDGGVIAGKGYMGYWESVERYPATQPDLWGDLCGVPIRHHKMPDEHTDDVCHRSTSDAQNIYILAVEFENIVWPTDNYGQRIPNIKGFEILVGSREGHKSIIAKGIMRNMFEYEVPEADSDGQGAVQGVFPNYPYNDLGPDPYLCDRNPIDNPGQTGSPLSGVRPDVLTFHSPETSFNRPFLNPYEVKSYGVTKGMSVGRFYKSEKHPGQKLLRDISAFVAAIIGMGYALGEMRGKRTKKQRSGGSLSIGRNIGPYAERITSDEVRGSIHKGGVAGAPNIVETGGITGMTVGAEAGLNLAPFGIGPDFTGEITGYFLTTANAQTENTMLTYGPPAQGLNHDGTHDDTVVAEVDYPGQANDPIRGGGDAPSQEPHMVEMAKDNVEAHENINTSAAGAEGQQEASGELLSDTQVIAGAGGDSDPEAHMTATGFPFAPGTVADSAKKGEARYMRNMNKAHNDAKKDTSGHMGPQDEVTSEGSRNKNLPNIFQLISKLYQFMNYMSTGGQEIIDLIYNLSSYRDYVLKYSSHGLYLNTQAQSNVYRARIDRARYVGDSFQNLTQNLKINNLNRPATVALVTEGASITLPGGDNSKFTLAGATSGWFGMPTSAGDKSGAISAHYVGLKLAFSNQYGQLDGIRQIPAPACYIDFENDLIKRNLIDENGELEVSNNTTFNSRLCFGGDTYLARYTEKVIMPFWWDFLYDQPDGYPFDYRNRINVPYPRYWANFERYDMSQFVQPFTDFSFNFSDMLPSSMRQLDGAAGFAEIVPNLGGGGTGGISSRGSIWVLGGKFMYTHCNGVNDFFVESEINTALRDWEDVPGKTHYDWLEYTDLRALFDAKIIRDGNFYKYDQSLSKNKFFTQLITFGTIQPRDYDPLVAEVCYDYYPKRLIYSNQASKESKKDFWKVFLPNNYKEFKNQVNVVKPISKSGAMILFPHLAPQMFQGVDQLTTDLKTKLTIGDGGLFSNPMQNVTNADLSHEYGSCESMRSVVNTPSGLYYISQAQGKIFHYTGQGISNIANYGMKHWFNKYLPSSLLHYFPEIEGTVDADNPVVGVGCQSIYDPNYDLIYFCKKDYAPLDTQCIEYDPEQGFVYNSTLCGGGEQTMECPTGYILYDVGDTHPGTGEVLAEPTCCDYDENIIEEDTEEPILGYYDEQVPVGSNDDDNPVSQPGDLQVTDNNSSTINPDDYQQIWANTMGGLKYFYWDSNSNCVPRWYHKPSTNSVVDVGWKVYGGAKPINEYATTLGDNPDTGQPWTVHDINNGPWNWKTNWLNDYNDTPVPFCPALNTWGPFPLEGGNQMGAGGTTPPQPFFFITDHTPYDDPIPFQWGSQDEFCPDNIYDVTPPTDYCSAVNNPLYSAGTNTFPDPTTSWFIGGLTGYTAMPGWKSTTAGESPLFYRATPPMGTLGANGDWPYAGIPAGTALWTGDAALNHPDNGTTVDALPNLTVGQTYAFSVRLRLPKKAYAMDTEQKINTFAQPCCFRQSPGSLVGGCGDVGTNTTGKIANGEATLVRVFLGGDDVADGLNWKENKDLAAAGTINRQEIATIYVSDAGSAEGNNNVSHQLDGNDNYIYDKYSWQSYYVEFTPTQTYTNNRLMIVADYAQGADDGDPDRGLVLAQYMRIFEPIQGSTTASQQGNGSTFGGPSSDGSTDGSTGNVDTTDGNGDGTTDTTPTQEYETIRVDTCVCPYGYDMVIDDGIYQTDADESMCLKPEQYDVICYRAFQDLSTINCKDVTLADSTYPIELGDSEYFKDVSWTVSYDPKSQSFISFHDWHPELALPSLNHFLTTQSIEDKINNEAYCPEGWNYDTETGQCIQDISSTVEAVNNVVTQEAGTAELARSECLIDLVLSIDTSGSTGSSVCSGGVCAIDNQRTFLNAFVDQYEDEMLAGYVQIGWGNWNSNAGRNSAVRTPHAQRLYTFADDLPPENVAAALPIYDQVSENFPFPGGFCVLSNCNDANNSMPTSNQIDSSWNIGMSNDAWTDGGDWGQFMPNAGGGTTGSIAVDILDAILKYPANSALGDRTGLFGYKQIAIVVSDSTQNVSGNFSDYQDGTHTLPDGTEVPCEIHSVFIDVSDVSSSENPGYSNVNMDGVTGQLGLNQWHLGMNNILQLGEQLQLAACQPPQLCTCPDDMEMFWANSDGEFVLTTNPRPDEDCRPDQVECRKIECYCPETPGISVDASNLTLTETGECDDLLEVGYSDYINPNPKMCIYDGEISMDASFMCGGIWKHNARCDLFANYYDKAYPWEIEYVASVGQSVETLRSVEYQLESYKYLQQLAVDIGNYDTPTTDLGEPSDTRCEDRYHVKNHNFNEAIIYNTEQISGLLKLNLESLATLTQYPFYDAANNAYQIAFSKVENKFRFNQFWDITDNRNTARTQFITDLDGYHKLLNQQNLDYQKLNEEQKKFRHYAHKILLRRTPELDYVEMVEGEMVEYYKPEDKKMILKLTNTKLNTSFR